MLACAMGSMGFGMMGFGWLATALLILVGAWLVIRGVGRREVDARTLVEQRFARGEIDQEEFERRRRVLEDAR
jgi:putative membrane protein